jgi:hypothetical protein
MTVFLVEIFSPFNLPQIDFVASICQWSDGNVAYEV